MILKSNFVAPMNINITSTLNSFILLLYGNLDRSDKIQYYSHSIVYNPS